MRLKCSYRLLATKPPAELASPSREKMNASSGSPSPCWYAYSSDETQANIVLNCLFLETRRNDVSRSMKADLERLLEPASDASLTSHTSDNDTIALAQDDSDPMDTGAGAPSSDLLRFSPSLMIHRQWIQMSLCTLALPPLPLLRLLDVAQSVIKFRHLMATCCRLAHGKFR